MSIPNKHKQNDPKKAPTEKYDSKRKNEIEMVEHWYENIYAMKEHQASVSYSAQPYYSSPHHICIFNLALSSSAASVFRSGSVLIPPPDSPTFHSPSTPKNDELF